MKPSKYNICLPYDDKYVIFNGVTKRFFLVSSKNKDTFLQILDSPNNYQEQYAPFLQQMAEEGFIIEDSIEELKVIQQQYENLNNGTTYKLMILPTYACNVNCWYCTQKHRNKKLSNNDVKRIKAHIVYYLTHNDIKQLNLCWFGGEPLINSHCIEEIATFAKTFCQEKDIEYRNTITTNGTLLNRQLLENMKTLNFTFFQITIDGVKEEHDQVKVLKGTSAYETTLKNICLIAEILPQAEICLRYNFSMKNLKPKSFIHSLNNYLPSNVRNRIKLSIMKIWQEDERNIDGSTIDDLVEIASQNGYVANVGSGFCVCYVDSHHFNCIFPNGMVDKCNNNDFIECRGIIAESGVIEWKQEPTFFNYNVFSHHNECYSCQYLPICYGPCPKERELSSKDQAPLSCRYNDKNRIWKYNVLHFCKQELRKNNII